LKVWADFGVGFVGQPGPNGEMLPAPTHWRRIVEALGFEIACAIGDQEGSYLAPVERLPGGCLLYRMAWRDAEVDRVIGRAPSAAPIPDPEVAA